MLSIFIISNKKKLRHSLSDSWHNFSRRDKLWHYYHPLATLEDRNQWAYQHFWL